MSQSLQILAWRRHPSPVSDNASDFGVLSQASNATSESEVEEQIMYTDSPLHLLSLPAEIKIMIWKAMLGLTSTRRDGNWFTLPRIEFAPLSLTCRQLYSEIEAFRPENKVPFEKFGNFVHELAIDFKEQKMARYRSLTLQFNHTASEFDFKALKSVLSACREHIEEFRLHFKGDDYYGTKTYLHGCAYSPNHGRGSKLPPEGQNNSMVPLIYEITRMTKLRILVLSNLNHQMFPMCFKHKSELEYLHLTADPRSAVHNHSHGFLGQISRQYSIRVRAMHIDANTMRNAFLIPQVCAETLEHLTWTLPDASLGSNMVEDDLFGHTVRLIDHLAAHARRLSTLRICIGGSGLRSNTQQYTDLERALTGSLNGIHSLRDYEVHVTGKSPWFSHSILTNLPRELERFYTTDELIQPRVLYNFIREKYLSANLSPIQRRRDPEEAYLAQWEPQPPVAMPTSDSYPEQNGDELKMWINPLSYAPRYLDGCEELMGEELVRSCANKGFLALFLPGIIGEDFRRKDYIPLRSGNLQFVSYNFKNQEYICRTQGAGETTKQMLLRLNGRLLDRERNKHLAKYGPCVPIPPQFIAAPESRVEGVTRYDILLHSVYSVEATDPRPRREILKELEQSQLRDDERYFGNEDAAERVFAREKVAKPEDVLPYSYPYYVANEEEGRHDSCRWMCPEADVPTLAQMGSLGHGPL